nr:hypothetical protein [Tanacetum cinerariifolium]
MPRECLKIIESKTKVRQTRSKAVVAKVSTSSSTPSISSGVAELKDMVRAFLLDKKNQSSAPASSSTPTPVKAVEPNCVTCSGTHSYQNCPATSGNVYRDNIQEYVSQAAAANYNQGNTGFRPQMVANQIRPPANYKASLRKVIPSNYNPKGERNEGLCHVGLGYRVAWGVGGMYCAPQLDCDDLEQINDDDLEEMDLKWHVAIISMRIKKFHKRTGILLETAKLKGIKTVEEEMLDTIETKLETLEDTQNFAMMAYSSSNSGSDNEVQSCSKTCTESYDGLKKLYDEQRDKLGDASVEITAYTLALK